jgi:hypothetical protein
LVCKDGFTDVREPGSGHLLFRYNAARDLVEIVRRGVRTVVDLAWYRTQSATERHEPGG